MDCLKCHELINPDEIQNDDDANINSHCKVLLENFWKLKKGTTGKPNKNDSTLPQSPESSSDSGIPQSISTRVASPPTGTPVVTSDVNPMQQSVQLLLSSRETYEQFCNRWRQHFLDTMHPQHLPSYWKPCLASPTDRTPIIKDFIRPIHPTNHTTSDSTTTNCTTTSSTSQPQEPDLPQSHSSE
ncbi:hypothetical protein Pelo_13708 [Pelomyxa schiedti]|nr:hypothetical protein Pelo_13708 [Pelomyxa schiedti]